MGVRYIFERLDRAYLNELVVRSRQGDSNAFAELFASVSDRQLVYLTYMFGSREEAADALTEVFATALKGLPGLVKEDLFMLWISRISYNVYLERSGQEKASNGKYSLSQLLNLPLAESQIMIMNLEQRLQDRQIEDILNIGTSTIKRFRKLAAKHLAGSEETGAGRSASAGTTKSAIFGNKDASAAHLTPIEAAHILESVFEACGCEPNNLPMETLSSYAVYRKERFSLQRGILTAALIVFLMIPAMFILPSVSVTVDDAGERGLPVYTVSVDSLLPVGKVNASLHSHNLPVYEASAKEYTIEPTRNGTLTIEIQLVNRQSASSKQEVTSVDAEGPVLDSNDIQDDIVVLKVHDPGIGVDYRAVYAIGQSGNIYYPISADEEGGIVFEYPDEPWDIYIPDHIGNTLHLAVKLK